MKICADALNRAAHCPPAPLLKAWGVQAAAQAELD